MSKEITQESLTHLRETFRMNLEAILDQESFDLSSVETKTIDYPDFSEEKLSRFMSIYKEDELNETDIAIYLYESLPLDELQASNNRYWIYLNLKYFFSFIKDRWINMDKEEDKISKDFEKHFLALQASQNALIQSPVAGLWWVVHLSYDRNNPEDPYHYTRLFLSERQLRTKNLGTYQLIRDKKTLFALLGFHEDYKNSHFDGKTLRSEALAQATSKTLNQIGGLTLLSFLSKDEIRAKLEQYKEAIFNRALGITERKVVSKKKKEAEIAEVQNAMHSTGRIMAVNEPSSENNKPENYKTLVFFNLKRNGDYLMTEEQPDTEYDYNVEITEEFVDGHLLVCYKEGFINRVTVSSLLQKRNRIYKNGIYKHYKIKSLMLVPKRGIVGIKYKSRGLKYFKAILTSQLKEGNPKIGLEGYKVLYPKCNWDYGSISFHFLPITYKENLNRLIFSTLSACGKSFKNVNYKKEFKIIRTNLYGNDETTLF